MSDEHERGVEGDPGGVETPTTPPPAPTSDRPAAPPTVRGAIRPIDRAVWPTTLGVISIVLGSLGSLANVWGVASMFFLDTFVAMSGAGSANGASMGQLGLTKPILIAQGVYSAIALGISIWLLIAGIGLVRRRRWGVAATQRWAWARLAMVLIQVGLTYWIQSGQFAAMRSESGAQGAGGGPALPGWFGGTMQAITVLFTLAWGSAWPIICLVWLRRAPVRAQHQTWT